MQQKPLQIETEFDRALRYYKHEVAEIEEPLRNRAVIEQDFKQLINTYPPTNMFRLIWELLWFTGMRPIEACWLQRDNFNEGFTELGYKVAKPRNIKQPDGTIKKSYKSRIVPIPLDLAIRLREYWQDEAKKCSPFGFMFPSFDKARLKQGLFYMSRGTLNAELSNKRKELGSRWLLKNSKGHHLLGPHSFRRGWISRHIDMTQNPAETARAIGHNCLDVTYEYYQPKQMAQRLQKFLKVSRVPEAETEIDRIKQEMAELRQLVLELKNDFKKANT